MLCQMQLNKIQNSQEWGGIAATLPYQKHGTRIMCVMCISVFVLCTFWLWGLNTGKHIQLHYIKRQTKLNPSYDQRNLNESPCVQSQVAKNKHWSVLLHTTEEQSSRDTFSVPDFVKSLKHWHYEHIHLTSCTHTAAQHCLHMF